MPSFTSTTKLTWTFTQTEIAAKTAELGGIHKYDLTPDVTHLIVGEYDTPKYRHVAKERPDILPMAAGWVEAVRDLWIEDAEIDFAALENAWKLRTFETSGGTSKDPEAEVASRNRLLCCMTGFDDADVRERIMETIQAHGGSYTGDLTRKVTHLIAYKPEGKKYAAAKMWNIHTVSLEWLQHSLQRGMILDDKCYDPVLPVEERGKGAWNRREVNKVSLGKRLRESAAAAQEDGRRKLRKTASMKILSQKENLWGDILGKPQPVEPPALPAEPTPVAEDPTQPTGRTSTPGQLSAQTSRGSLHTQGSKLLSFSAVEEVAVYSSCCFYVHGFSERRSQILHGSIVSLGGIICHSLDEVASASGAQMAHRFVIVPQDSHPDLRPKAPENVQLVTEFFVEKCMYKTQFFDPSTQVIGRPFPAFPIPGFDKLAICTAGFTGVDLNQVDKAIRQLGARYDERFTAQSSLLICTSLNDVRKQKLDLALAWKVPVVRADWLWTCIADGAKVPIKPFLFKELRQRFDAFDNDATRPSMSFEKPKEVEKRSVQEKPVAPATKQHSRRRAGEIDGSAFSTEPLPPRAAAPVETRPKVSKEDSNVTADFETAPTHHSGGLSFSRKASLPLSETSQNSLNQSRSPERKRSQPQKTPVEDTSVQTAAVDVLPHTNSVPPDAEIAPTEPSPPKPTTNSNPDPPKRASLPPSERLALSAKLATLFETPSNPDPASHLPAIDPSRPAVRRRREILGRAISNVSATSSGSHDSSAPPDPNPLLELAPASVGEGPGEDRNLSSTQVGYDDPEAEMYKKKLMGGCKALGAGGVSKMGAGEGAPLTLATSGGYDVAPARGTRTRRTGR